MENPNFSFWKNEISRYCSELEYIKYMGKTTEKLENENSKEFLKFSSFFDGWCHDGHCRSITAKPADNSCRRKEHSQTREGIDEL